MSLSAVRFPYHVFPEVEIHGVMTCIFKVTDVCYHVTWPPVLWKVMFYYILASFGYWWLFGKEREYDRSLACQDMCKYWVNTGKMMPARVPRGRRVSLIPSWICQGPRCERSAADPGWGDRTCVPFSPWYMALWMHGRAHSLKSLWTGCGDMNKSQPRS